MRGCSTPVGVIEKNTELFWHRSHEFQSVLNACRRHREKHSFRHYSVYLCLNRAQRLSASSRKTQHKLGSNTASTLACSTPVGVIEKNTLAALAKAAGLVVCSTPVGVIEKNTACSPPGTVQISCAQRLSASSRKTQNSIHVSFRLV